MTDQTIPADKVRRARQWARDTLDDVENGANVSAYARDAARTLIAMMPRPTLADMTYEERRECRWMQADVIGFRGKYVLVSPSDWDGDAVLLDREGDVYYEHHARVTPRPDLPRMEWPGNKKAEDVPPVKVGDVIESADDPRLAALPVWTVLRDIDGEEVTRSEGGPGTWRGTGYIPIPTQGTEFGPWTVRRIGLEDDQ